MSARGRYRGGYRGGHGAGTPKKGHFTRGQWLCDCNPPLPAVHFETKKEGPNKGRWFYKCQKNNDDPDYCKFFLWEDQAKPREESALLSNSRTEPTGVITTPSRPQRTARVSPPPPYKPIDDISSSSGRKRGRQVVEDEDEEFGWAPDEDFTRDLEGAAIAAETPRKAARADAYTTPRKRTLPWVKESTSNGVPTPQTEGRFAQDPFPTRFSTPGSSLLSSSQGRQDEATRGYRLPSPNTTPTPARYKDVNLGDADDGLVKKVFDVLREGNASLNEGARDNLKDVLNRYSIRTQGIIKGREVSRLSIKAKDAKIAELQYRVNTLENELEAERAMVKHLRWKAETGDDSDATEE